MEVKMRLWSIHPKYLDSKGLVALWREALLAQKVLAGKTKGYQQHPQLIRFKKYSQPLVAIGSYLKFIHNESLARQYQFDHSKIFIFCEQITLPVTEGQLQYEWEHLYSKLQKRDLQKFQENLVVQQPVSHPLFLKTAGGIASWERRIV
jgi:hypothetical protein